MTQLQFMQRLSATKTQAAYKAALDTLKAENGGDYPDWYYGAVVASGFANAKAHQFHPTMTGNVAELEARKL